MFAKCDEGENACEGTFAIKPLRENVREQTFARIFSCMRKRSRENVREGTFARERVRESVRERAFTKGDEGVNARERISLGAIFRATVVLR